MVINIQIANSTQLSFTCTAQTVTSNIADSMDNYISADHIQMCTEKIYLTYEPSWGRAVLDNRDRW